MRCFVLLSWLLPFSSQCLVEMLHSRLDTLLPQIGARHLTVVLPGEGGYWRDVRLPPSPNGTHAREIQPMASPASWRQFVALKAVADEARVRVNVASLDTLLTSRLTLAQGAVLMPVAAFARLTPMLPTWGLSVAVILYSSSAPAAATFLDLPGQVPCDSQVFVASPLGADALALDEIYHAGEAEMIVRRVATTTAGGWQFDTKPTELRRADLRGAVMRIAQPALQYDHRDATGYGNMVNNTQLFITETLHVLNASWRGVRYEGDMIGTRNKLGAWSGMVGSVQRGDADLGNFGLGPSSAWFGLIDLVYPFSGAKYRLYARKPGFSYDLSSLAKGFSAPLWAASITSLLALTACVWAALRWPARQCMRVDVSLCALLVLSGCCLTGWEFRPRDAPARALCAMTGELGYLLNVAYSSSLRARLTTGTGHLPFEDLATLRTTPEYMLLLFPGTPPHQNLKDTVTAGGVSEYTSLKDGLERACVDRVVVFGLSAVCDKLMKQTSCELVTVRGDYYTRHLHFPARLHFPYTRILGYYIRRYVEAGLYLHWYSFKAPPGPPVTPAPLPTELSDVAPLLLLYSACAAFCCSLLLGEIAVARLRGRDTPRGGKI